MFLLAAFRSAKINTMGIMDRKQSKLTLIEVVSGKLRRAAKARMLDAAPDVYEIRPREDGDGFDLISDRFRRGPIWYAGPDAVRKAVAYAKFCSLSRSRRAIICVLNQSGCVIETH
jgi:hypothetical protein